MLLLFNKQLKPYNSIENLNCAIQANFSRRLSISSTFIWGKCEGGNWNQSRGTTSHKVSVYADKNIQAREVRRTAQSALWLMR